MTLIKKYEFNTLNAFMALALGLCLYSNNSFAAPPSNSIDYCFKEYVFSDSTPPINLKHVFCGEVDQAGYGVGFHAKPNGPFPPSATATVYVPPAPPEGSAYELQQVGIRRNSIEMSYSKKNTPNSSSSMFPDSCSEAQITASILYAYNNQTNPNSLRGPSAPNINDKKYCLTTDNKVQKIIMISMMLANKKPSKNKPETWVINSAYPR